MLSNISKAELAELTQKMRVSASLPDGNQVEDAQAHEAQAQQGAQAQ